MFTLRLSVITLFYKHRRKPHHVSKFNGNTALAAEHAAGESLGVLMERMERPCIYGQGPAVSRLFSSFHLIIDNKGVLLEFVIMY